MLLAAVVLVGLAACSGTTPSARGFGGLSCSGGGGRGIGSDYNGTEPGQPTPEAALATFLAAHAQPDSLLADGYVADPNGALVIPPRSLAPGLSSTQVVNLTYIHRSGGRVDVVVSSGPANLGWHVQTVIACDS